LGIPKRWPLINQSIKNVNCRLNEVLKGACYK